MRATQEVAMKKTYSTPAIAESGSVISETRGTIDDGNDAGGVQKLLPEGSVGFNL